LNLRPSGYEPDELPGCSTPRGCGGDGVVRLGSCGAGAEKGGRVLRLVWRVELPRAGLAATYSSAA
jgi:hypothetical protein